MNRLIALAAGAAVVGLSQAAEAATLKTLFNFNGTNGAYPYAAVVMDRSGNLYGTTPNGGSSTACGSRGCGTVFKLTPPLPGTTAWTRKTLIDFDRTSGTSPYDHLVIDRSGNLYGTTFAGGTTDQGTVFRLTPPAAGKTAWTRKTLVSFNSTNGAFPFGGLSIDGSGNLYGTTSMDGLSNYGTVFQLTPPTAARPAWTVKTLVNFNGTNGAAPYAGVIMDGSGNLYGTTPNGGTSQYGVVFQLTPPAAGRSVWSRKTLINGNWTVGAAPYGELIMDKSGILYGTMSGGGLHGYGTVFELTPPAAGKTTWTRKTLVNFNLTNGAYPHAGLTMDAAGNLYGTTAAGGASGACGDLRCGTVFKLTPPVAGKTTWTFKTLVDFNLTDGAAPVAALIMDGAGNLYGTTSSGGLPRGCEGSGCGTVFKLIP